MKHREYRYTVEEAEMMFEHVMFAKRTVAYLSHEDVIASGNKQKYREAGLND